MQGNHGPDTHIGELSYAFDFALRVGTPVLASADGVVVAAVGNHRSGGRHSKEMRVKANYVALRHDSGLYSRYYHLCHNGVCVAVGDRVACGTQIGRSGNTGFSGAPHLHWDVVDVFPLETATLVLERGAGDIERLDCVAAAFSGALPPVDQPLRCRACWADPSNAGEPSLRNGSEQTCGAVVLIHRCADVDFIDKARRAEAAGAAAVIVVGNVAGLAPFTMGMAKNASPRRVGIPAVMVSHSAGEAISQALHSSHHASPMLILGRSEHFHSRAVNHEARSPQDSVTRPHQVHLGEIDTASEFVPLTQPAAFYSPEHPKHYIPQTGSMPPIAVQRADGALMGSTMLGFCLTTAEERQLS